LGRTDWYANAMAPVKKSIVIGKVRGIGEASMVRENEKWKKNGYLHLP